MKTLFYENDEYRSKPYFNDAKELFKIWFWAHFRKRLIVNRNKFDWETFNTTKIKAVFYSIRWADNDYGTKLRFKCHQRIQRKARTLKGELCSNWELIDSFGVRLDDRVYLTDVNKKFYSYPRWWDQGQNPELKRFHII